MQYPRQEKITVFSRKEPKSGGYAPALGEMPHGVRAGRPAYPDLPRLTGGPEAPYTPPTGRQDWNPETRIGFQSI